MNRPEIFVIAGPNGAGKTTCALNILPERFPASAFINADEIARSLGTDSILAAGRAMLRQIHDARDRYETFAFETTLAARSYVRFLNEARAAGYNVHIAHVWLSSVELARKRVAVRVQRGGHDVPPADVERRYWRGLRNFFALYRDLADTWVLCDNSSKELVVVARGLKGVVPMIDDRARYQRILDAVGPG